MVQYAFAEKILCPVLQYPVPVVLDVRQTADRRPSGIALRDVKLDTWYRKFVLLYNCAKEDISNSFLICLINVYPVDFMNHKLSRLRYPTASRTVGTSLLANNQVQTSGNATLWHQHRVQLRWATFAWCSTISILCNVVLVSVPQWFCYAFR